MTRHFKLLADDTDDPWFSYEAIAMPGGCWSVVNGLHVVASVEADETDALLRVYVASHIGGPIDHDRALPEIVVDIFDGVEVVHRHYSGVEPDECDVAFAEYTAGPAAVDEVDLLAALEAAVEGARRNREGGAR